MTLIRYSFCFLSVRVFSAPSTPRQASVIKEFQDVAPYLFSNLEEEKYRRNLLKVEVFYEEFNYEQVAEVPAYTVSA